MERVDTDQQALVRRFDEVQFVGFNEAVDEPRAYFCHLCRFVYGDHVHLSVTRGTPSLRRCFPATNDQQSLGFNGDFGSSFHYLFF